MNDESMDELIALYRKTAQEAPLPATDARILQLAENHRHAHRRKRHWTWFAAAVAASALLWLAGHRTASPPLPPRARVAADNSRPGYLEGRNRIYLMSMDIAPPRSTVAQFLLQQSTPSD